MTAKSLISIFPLTWKRHLLTFSRYKYNSLQMIRQKIPGTQTSYNAETRGVVSCCCGRVQPPNDVTQRLKRQWTIPTLDYEQSLFFLGPSSKTCEIRKWPRAWLKAAALVSRLSRLPRSTLALACTPLTKSEEKETLLAVYTHTTTT